MNTIVVDPHSYVNIEPEQLQNLIVKWLNS